MALNDKYKVYTDPLFPQDNKILIGHKGPSHLDTGYVHAPYVPYLGPSEPSIVDRIAAIDADPESDLVKRIKEYDEWVARVAGPAFLDPGDPTLRKGLRTRYVKRLVKPEHFPAVKVVDL